MIPGRSEEMTRDEKIWLPMFLVGGKRDHISI
jgi:hypothetical protein